jgi:hypothetical protein
MDSTDPKKLYKQFVKSPLVPMTLRVAVAGHREHSNIRVDNNILIEQISNLYKMLYEQLINCYEHPYARRLYSSVRPTLRILSSLADGADRLLLEPDLVGQEFELSCVLPFNAKEYANDFKPSSQTEFYRLLDKAGYSTPSSRVLELNGSRENSDHAYRDCGDILVKNCDVLVALYDGKQKEGFGTAWTVKLANKQKIPVVWIDIEHPNEIRFIQHNGNDTSLIEFTKHEMRDWLRHLLLFDTILDSHADTELAEKVLNKFDHYAAEQALSYHPEYLVDFNDGGPIGTKHNFFNPLAHGFSFLKKALTPSKLVNTKLADYSENTPSHKDLTDSVDHLCELFHNPSSHAYYAAYLRADRMANFYATLHRGIFIFIYILGAMALIIAAFAIAVSDPKVYGNLAMYCAMLELVLLFSIYILYRQDHGKELHDKWLEYRCIAEFLRPTLFLSFFGTNYPMRRFRDNEETIGRNLLGHGGAERCWAYLYTETVLRWVGFSGHTINSEYLSTSIDFTRRQWLGKQYHYHTKNAIGMKILGKNLAKISEVMFVATIVVVTIKIGMSMSGVYSFYLSKVLGLLATWLPVLGTTAFAIRNHAEFEISAQRSLSTREMLLSYNQQLQQAQISNLNLENVDRLLTELTALSITETADWLEIYEVKESETA